MMELLNSSCVLEHTRNLTSCQYIKSHCDPSFFFAAKSYYCSISYPSFWLALCYSAVLLSAVAIMMIILSLIVSNYLLYCVTNFTDLLGINHKVLSFFVIPLTNSLPDLFNYHTAMKSDSVDLILGQVIGANLITFTIIIGLISVISPFSIRSSNGIVLGLVWAWVMILILAFVLSDSKVNLFECVLMCALFLIYAWSLYFLKSNEVSNDLQIEAVVSNKGNPIDERTVLLANTSVNGEVADPRKPPYRAIIDGFTEGFDHLIFFFIPISKLTLHRLKRNEHSFKVLLFNSHFFHFWMVIESCLLFNYNTFKIRNLWAVGIATLIYITFEVARRSANDVSCNIIVDIASILNSLGIISLATRATLQLLKNLGAIWRFSEYTMGLLIFSLVNSLNDIAMNVLLSANLSPGLGVNSCLGTCLISILFGIGMNGIVRLLSRKSNSGVWRDALLFTLSPEIYLSTASLLIVILLYLIYVPWNDWRFDRRIGIFAMSAWLATTVSCLLMDFRLNH